MRTICLLYLLWAEWAWLIGSGHKFVIRVQKRCVCVAFINALLLGWIPSTRCRPLQSMILLDVMQTAQRIEVTFGVDTLEDPRIETEVQFPSAFGCSLTQIVILQQTVSCASTIGIFTRQSVTWTRCCRAGYLKEWQLVTNRGREVRSVGDNTRNVWV